MTPFYPNIPVPHQLRHLQRQYSCPKPPGGSSFSSWPNHAESASLERKTSQQTLKFEGLSGCNHVKFKKQFCKKLLIPCPHWSTWSKERRIQVEPKAARGHIRISSQQQILNMASSLQLPGQPWFQTEHFTRCPLIYNYTMYSIIIISYISYIFIRYSDRASKNDFLLEPSGQVCVLFATRLSGGSDTSRAPNICWESWCLREMQWNTTGLQKDPNTEYTQSYYMHITSFNFATNSDSQAAIWPNCAKIFCKVRLLTSAYNKENCHIATILVSCHRLCSESKLSKLPLN